MYQIINVEAWNKFLILHIYTVFAFHVCIVWYWPLVNRPVVSVHLLHIITLTVLAFTCKLFCKPSRHIDKRQRVIYLATGKLISKFCSYKSTQRLSSWLIRFYLIEDKWLELMVFFCLGRLPLAHTRIWQGHIRIDCLLWMHMLLPLKPVMVMGK